jgi:REP element-mobilizing transposase RayT
MARPLRILFPGAVYHVFARGNERRDIFREETDFVRFLELLELGIERHGWLCHAYCLMNNHYHLLVETPRANHPEGMRHLNGRYTQDFNRRHDRVGHLFQGRYQAVLVEKEPYLLTLVRYIARNPLAIDGCDRPQDWRWSSYGEMLGERPAPSWLTTDWVVARFGQTTERGRHELRAYVDGDHPASDLDVHGVILGSEDFIREKSADVPASLEIPRLQRQPLPPSLDELLRMPGDQITAAYRDWGYAMCEIATHIGCHYSTISRHIKRAEQKAA